MLLNNLLKNTKKAPNLIAAEVGYDSYDHFARLFKKKYGVTPKEYRGENMIKPNFFFAIYILNSEQASGYILTASSCPSALLLVKHPATAPPT